MLDDIEFASQTKVVPVLARASLLAAAIGKAYERIGVNVGAGRRTRPQPVEFDAEEAGKLLATLEQQQARTAASATRPSIEQSDNSLVRLINSMIVEAHSAGRVRHPHRMPARAREGAHPLPQGRRAAPYLELPHTYRSAMIARIKIMCDLDISERRKPQDGKINFGKFVAAASASSCAWRRSRPPTASKTR